MPVGARGDLNGPSTARRPASTTPTPTAHPMTTPIVNAMTNFGWEYVWHCHILSHEEMDMMRPMYADGHIEHAERTRSRLEQGRRHHRQPELDRRHTGQLPRPADLGHQQDARPRSATRSSAPPSPRRWRRHLGRPLRRARQPDRAPDAAAGSGEVLLPRRWRGTRQVRASRTSCSPLTLREHRRPSCRTAGQRTGRPQLDRSGDNGGAPVTGYAIQRTIDGGATWTTMTSNSGSAATTERRPA